MSQEGQRHEFVKEMKDREIRFINDERCKKC